MQKFEAIIAKYTMIHQKSFSHKLVDREFWLSLYDFNYTNWCVHKAGVISIKHIIKSVIGPQKKPLFAPNIQRYFNYSKLEGDISHFLRKIR